VHGGADAAEHEDRRDEQRGHDAHVILLSRFDAEGIVT
jgi:hypothetical protein